MGEFHRHEARAVLVADPDCPPDLLEFARDLLVTGGTGAASFQSTGPQRSYEEILALQIADNSDLVVVLRTEPRPSREVLTAARLARSSRKPLHTLVQVGVESGVQADESHAIEIDPSWEGRQEL